MKAEVLGVDDPRWRSFLGGVRHDFYHLPAYVSLSARDEGGEPGAVLVADNAQTMLLPLITRATCGRVRVDQLRPVAVEVIPIVDRRRARARHVFLSEPGEPSSDDLSPVWSLTGKSRWWVGASHFAAFERPRDTIPGPFLPTWADSPFHRALSCRRSDDRCAVDL
jgi:hypothetical protein